MNLDVSIVVLSCRIGTQIMPDTELNVELFRIGSAIRTLLQAQPASEITIKNGDTEYTYKHKRVENGKS